MVSTDSHRLLVTEVRGSLSSAVLIKQTKAQASESLPFPSLNGMLSSLCERRHLLTRALVSFIHLKSSNSVNICRASKKPDQSCKETLHDVRVMFPGFVSRMQQRAAEIGGSSCGEGTVHHKGPLELVYTRLQMGILWAGFCPVPTVLKRKLTGCLHS